MTLLIGLNSWSIPQWPVGKDPYNWTSAAMFLGGSGANNSPTLPSTLNDGSYLVLNSGTTTITLNNSSGTAIWTKAVTSLAASATGLINSVWIDTVDGALYGIAVNSGSTTAYPFKIVLSTGVATQIGAGLTIPSNFLSAGSISIGYLTRSAQGSGDFTLFGGNAGNAPRQISFSSSTGNQTVAIANVLSGSSALGNMFMTIPSIGYRTLDTTILMALVMPNIGSTNVSPIGIAVYRNGKAAVFSPQQFSAYTTAAGSMNTYVLMTVVGNSVLATSGTIPQGQIPMMLRSDFDTFLANVCTYMGI